MSSASASLSPRRAFWELVFAGVMWGFGFVSQKITLESWTPLGALTVRFGCAFLVGLPVILLSKRLRRTDFRALLKLTFVPGILMGMTLFLQNMGVGETSVTNSSFITTLYALWVPLLEGLVFRRPIRPAQWSVVLVALFGTALLCQLQNLIFNRGDLLVFICSMTAAIHIVWIGRIQHKIESPMAFNIFQAFWVMVIGGAICILRKDHVVPTPFSWMATLAMGQLIVFATLFAFMIQLRAQRVIDSSTSAILFLLEAPFGALFGWWLMHEKLSGLQLIGAVLIFGAAIAATRLVVTSPQENSIKSNT